MLANQQRRKLPQHQRAINYKRNFRGDSDSEEEIPLTRNQRRETVRKMKGVAAGDRSILMSLRRNDVTSRLVRRKTTMIDRRSSNRRVPDDEEKP
ncbi:uncharacterized protein LOC124599576 isoform X2 [Schistocerca americana]|uniref:uncharacterized protein LOC124599576 isoform X2 n=1 Tax=Schistocerca americana TaxID=7009 RepID=UPI001F4F1F1D|nr:uncharacterized protein LOC124599576 isoform X2 [Schistocerca americana]